MRNEFTRIRNECRRRQKELDFTIEARARAARAAGNRDWGGLHIAEVAKLERAKREEFDSEYALRFGEPPGENQARSELNDQTREGWGYRIGQGAFLHIELMSGAGLAAMTLNGGVVMSTLVGGVLALLVAGAASAVVSRWVRRGAATQPAKQMHRVTRGLIVLGSIWLLALITALTILRSPDSAIGASLFWVAMALITLLSPLCSGLCGVAAELLLWSRRICRNLVAIRSLSRELELLELASARSLSPSVVSRGIRAGAAGLFLAVLGGANGRAADRPVYMYVDVSPSASAGEVTQLLKNFARVLSGYEGADSLVVSVIPFYENAYMATPFVEVRIPGSRSRDCPLGTTEIISISQSYADARRRQCDQLRLQAKKEAAFSRSTEISKLSAAIDRLGELKVAGKCTAVNAMVRRAVRERPNGFSIVISDMENTCLSRDPPANFRPENQTFLIPVGSRQHPIEEGFDGIQARLARTMPWVQVIESFRLEVVMNALAAPELPMSPAH